MHSLISLNVISSYSSSPSSCRIISPSPFRSVSSSSRSSKYLSQSAPSIVAFAIRFVFRILGRCTMVLCFICYFLLLHNFLYFNVFCCFMSLSFRFTSLPELLFFKPVISCLLLYFSNFFLSYLVYFMLYFAPLLLIFLSRKIHYYVYFYLYYLYSIFFRYFLFNLRYFILHFAITSIASQSISAPLYELASFMVLLCVFVSLYLHVYSWCYLRKVLHCLSVFHHCYF